MPTDTRCVLVPREATEAMLANASCLIEDHLARGWGRPTFADQYRAAIAARPAVGEEEVRERAKAVCRERCAFMGEPACWEADPDNWPNPTCDDPGCIALTRAAIEGET